MSAVAWSGAHRGGRRRARRFRLLVPAGLAGVPGRYRRDADRLDHTAGRPCGPGCLSLGPAEVDLAYARAAASDVLASAGKDASVAWRNPQSGASGNITPLDTAYSEDGHPCRDFLASYVHGLAQDWLQGAACRSASGTWEVTRLIPLKPS